MNTVDIFQKKAEWERQNNKHEMTCQPTRQKKKKETCRYFLPQVMEKFTRNAKGQFLTPK